MCDCQQQRKEWGERAAEVGKVTTLLEGLSYQNLYLKKNRFIENSCAHSHGRPSCPPLVLSSKWGKTLRVIRPKPAWTLWYQILKGYGGLTGLQQRKPTPSGRLGRRRSWAEQSQGRGVKGWGREAEPSVHPSLGCRRSSYSAALASAPSALPSTSSSEQSPVPFRTIRRVTTNGMSPRLWAEAEGQWGQLKRNGQPSTYISK